MSIFIYLLSLPGLRENGRITPTRSAWYKEDQWPRLVSVCEDELSPSYSEWLKGAKKAMEKGIGDTQFVKVEVDVDELLSFCADNGLNVNGKARTAFVNHRLKEILANSVLPI